MADSDKDRGLRSTLRERPNDRDAEKALDEFTVLQDVEGGDLSARAHEINETADSSEEAIAASPLLALNEDQTESASPREDGAAQAPITDTQNPTTQTVLCAECRGFARPRYRSGGRIARPGCAGRSGWRARPDPRRGGG